MIVQIGSNRRIELNAIMMYQVIEGINCKKKLEISFQNGRELIMNGTEDEIRYWVKQLDRVCGTLQIEKVPNQEHYCSSKDTETTQQELLLE